VDNDVDIFEEGVGGGGLTISSYQKFYLTELYETLLPPSLIFPFSVQPLPSSLSLSIPLTHPPPSSNLHQPPATLVSSPPIPPPI